ncbi:response regulator [Sporomusa aerivorans]|uniref:response regulator n=1 Tax=Sporomusa aerivorans TaxID=204936 RepID=UPI00352BB188
MKKVLIVDDAAFIRLTLKMMLEKNGYTVIGVAEDGSDAIKKYTELRPDIVTMDITMPEMDGITAVKEIMKIDPEATIVMVSAMGQEEMVKDAIMAGARNFIVKPFSQERVLRALSAF